MFVAFVKLDVHFFVFVKLDVHCFVFVKLDVHCFVCVFNCGKLEVCVTVYTIKKYYFQSGLLLFQVVLIVKGR